MNKLLIKPISKRLVPLYILLFVCTSKWLFEGILDMPILEDVILMVAVAAAMVQARGKIRGSVAVWLLYIANLILSVLLHDPTVGRLGRAMLMSLMTGLILFMDDEPDTYDEIYSRVIRLAVFYAAFLVLQFVLRTGFNSLYFPLLTPSYQYVANHYYSRGYFFGLMFNPHQIAALMALAIVTLALRQMIGSEKKPSRWVLAVALFVPLLLTQKKGVLGFSLVAFFIVVCILYATRKQALKIIGITAAIAVVLTVLVRYSLTHTNSVFFYRIANFVTRLAAGEISDSGRSALYSIAIQEFSRHKLLGIGWRMFNGTIRSTYGYQTGHEVNMDYLQWLCETGIIGFIMNVIPVLVMLYRSLLVSFRYARKMESSRKKCVIMIALYTQLFTVLYAFFEIPFYDNLCFGLYVLSCVVINGAYYEMRRSLSADGALEPQIGEAL